MTKAMTQAKLEASPLFVDRARCVIESFYRGGAKKNRAGPGLRYIKKIYVDTYGTVPSIANLNKHVWSNTDLYTVSGAGSARRVRVTA